VILVDAGPLVALVDAGDQYHEDCLLAFQQIREPIGTVWPAMVEAMYFLSDLPMAQDRLWQMLEDGGYQILGLGQQDIPRIRALMRKYADRQMGLVDAALVAVAERDHIDTIFTVDRKDFSVYRFHGRGRFKIIP